MIDLKSIIEDIKILEVLSPAFLNNTQIPEKYTCDGENINPPLTIGNIPADTKSLVIILEDTDSLTKNWTHWVVWNIMPVKKIRVKSSLGIKGRNDFGQTDYKGPCPLIGTHHYHFKVYALDDILDIKAGSTKHELETIMSSHIIAFGELVGLYKNSFYQ